MGTSYTLDLLALMTAPLAFTFFDCEDDQGRATTDPLALLEAVRRHAGRIALFCQAGRIAVPATGRTLLTYLEDSVFETAAPREGGLFHPKIWLLRYVSAVEDDPVRYRLLCLSRNLTFDRAWDTALVLDGDLTARTRGIKANESLGELMGALPRLAIRSVPAAVRDGIELMRDEVRRVRFDLPEGFESCRFWALGLSGRRVWPFPNARTARRFLVVSPFVSDSFVGRVTENRTPGIIVSRAETLSELKPETLARFEHAFVLHPSADAEDEDLSVTPETDTAAVDAGAVNAASFTGLHAKLYVMDDGWAGRIWTGSANATKAAFEGNVEFLVELVGRKSVCGIDAILGDPGSKEATLASLLVPFAADDQSPPDPEEHKLELAVERLAEALSRIPLRARVLPVGNDDFSLELSAAGAWPGVPRDLSITCRPVTLPSGAAIPIHPGAEILGSFGPLTVELLTQFFAIDLTLRMGNREKRTRFVVNVPLEGAPADRRQRVLRSLLHDSGQVLRLISLLLATEDVSVQDWLDVGVGAGGYPWHPSSTNGFPILETMLKALEHDPAKLDEVARLVADLRRTPEGAALLPPGFDLVWEPVWKIREELR